MSKVINKKLHPYYKTGIYGWIGEEVDDNDYIICPICGDVLGVNYCDYSAEQGYYDKCPKCKQELDYSEIYDFEDTCYFEQLLEIKESRLADLEAKLSESEEKINMLEEHKFYADNIIQAYADKCKKADQDKISFAVEQLEKVKEKLLEELQNVTDLLGPLEYEDYHEFIGCGRGYKNSIEEIDNQIKRLEEMK